MEASKRASGIEISSLMANEYPALKGCVCSAMTIHGANERIATAALAMLSQLITRKENAEYILKCGGLAVRLIQEAWCGEAPLTIVLV